MNTNETTIHPSVKANNLRSRYGRKCGVLGQTVKQAIKGAMMTCVKQCKQEHK